MAYVRWREAWQEALYGPDGFFVTSRPADHFRTAVTASGLFAEAVSHLAPASLHQWVERRMKGVVAAAVQGVYEGSNDCSSRLIGIDLSSYGYARTEAARRADEGRRAA